MSDTSRYIPEHRRAQHKGRNQFRGDELRRRREDQQVEIRKQKKEESLAKRRNLDTKFLEWEGEEASESEDDENGALRNEKVKSHVSYSASSCYRGFLKLRSWELIVDYVGFSADGCRSIL